MGNEDSKDDEIPYSNGDDDPLPDLNDDNEPVPAKRQKMNPSLPTMLWTDCEPRNGHIPSPTTRRPNSPTSELYRRPTTRRRNSPPSELNRCPATRRRNSPPSEHIRRPAARRLYSPPSELDRRPTTRRNVSRPPEPTPPVCPASPEIAGPANLHENSLNRCPATRRRNSPPSGRIRRPATRRLYSPPSGRIRRPATRRLYSPPSELNRRPTTRRRNWPPTIGPSRRPTTRRNVSRPPEPTPPVCPASPEIAGPANLRENSLLSDSAAKENEHKPSAQSLESITAGLSSEGTARPFTEAVQENSISENETGPPNTTKVPARRSSICEPATNDLVPDTSSNDCTLESNRSITPNSSVPLEDIISPSTVNEIRYTIRALFPNGPPKPPPIIPVKKQKKGDTPYIVGCTKRKRVPESKSLKFFIGDNYGITSKTNALDDEDAPLHTPAKRSRITYNGKISKSRFNPHSDEIAARLKQNETMKSVDDLLRNPSQNGSTLSMSNQLPTRLSEFSPIPSTSKGIETIQKNDKQYMESINASEDNDEASDNEDLPEVILTTKCTQKKKKRNVQNENLNPLTVTIPTVINDIVSQINSESYLKEIDFHGIFMMKKSPSTEDFFESNRCISPIVIDDESMNEDKLQPDTAMKQDDIIEIKDNTMTLNEISEIRDNATKQNGTIEIKDNTLNDFPQEEKIVDVDEILAEYEAYKRERDRKKLNSANIINIVDPITLEATKSEIFTKTNSYQATTYRNTVDLVTPHAALSDDKGDEICEPVPSTSTTNLAVNLTQSNIDEGCNSFPSTSSKKDNTVDLAKPQSTSNEPLVNEFEKKKPSTGNKIVEIVDLENCKNLPSTSPPVIIIPDVTESAANVPPGTSTRRYWWSDDVEIVSETLPDRQGSIPNNDVEIVEERRNGRTDLTICFVLGAPHLTRKEPDNQPTTNQPLNQPLNQPINQPLNQPINQPSLKSNEEQWEETSEFGLGHCPICLERLQKTSVASTTCGHVFCIACLRQALRRSGKRCPTCRKSLRGVGYTQLFL